MNFIQHYTGLPNCKVVKTIFDFVVGEQFHGITKLTAKVALLKLRHIGSCKFSIFNFFSIHPVGLPQLLYMCRTSTCSHMNPCPTHINLLCGRLYKHVTLVQSPSFIPRLPTRWGVWEQDYNGPLK